MDNGDVLAVGLPVQKLVGVVCELDSDHAIIPHPPMVVQTVQEMQTVAIDVTTLHVQVVRMKKFCMILIGWICCLVDGGWGTWSDYSSCSATCGEGQQTRRRVCDNPPASDGGADCDGVATNQRTCNIIACPTNPSSTTLTLLTTTTSCSGATCTTSTPSKHHVQNFFFLW